MLVRASLPDTARSAEERRGSYGSTTSWRQEAVRGFDIV